MYLFYNPHWQLLVKLPISYSISYFYPTISYFYPTIPYFYHATPSRIFLTYQKITISIALIPVLRIATSCKMPAILDMLYFTKVSQCNPSNNLHMNQLPEGWVSHEVKEVEELYVFRQLVQESLGLSSPPPLILASSKHSISMCICCLSKQIIKSLHCKGTKLRWCHSRSPTPGEPCQYKQLKSNLSSESLSVRNPLCESKLA